MKSEFIAALAACEIVSDLWCNGRIIQLWNYFHSITILKCNKCRSSLLFGFIFDFLLNLVWNLFIFFHLTLEDCFKLIIDFFSLLFSTAESCTFLPFLNPLNKGL